MSLPIGSQILNAISISEICYLIDENVVADVFSTDNFSSRLAKPLANYDIKLVDPNLTRTIEESFPEILELIKNHL